MKRIAVLAAAAALLLSCAPVVAAQKELKKEDIKAIAMKAVRDKGIVLKEVDILYDEGGKLWLERSGLIGIEDKSPNHGILKHGFLKNYRIVYFNFRDPVVKDIWVFIDKDTSEVLTVYVEQ